MARKWKSETVVEIRMSDGGWIRHPRTEKVEFKTPLI